MIRIGLGLLLLMACACRSDKAPEEKAGEPPASSASPSKPAQSTKKPADKRAEKGQPAVRLPGVMEAAPWLADAGRVVAYGGRDNAIIVAAGVGWLRWFSLDGTKLGEREAVGGVQVLEVVDLDGDGTMEILFGKGRARGAKDAPATLEVLHLGKKLRVETIELPTTTRAQVVAAVPVPGKTGELWVASFVTKFEVAVNRYERTRESKWLLAESRGVHRVVGDMTVLPDGTPVIARMYGDTTDADGGVYALTSAETLVQIPSTRGARAVLAMPAPAMAVAMADGWHKEYGRKAEGLVSVVAQEGSTWGKVAGLQVAGTYGFSRLRLGNVHNQEGPELIISGNGNAHVVLPTRPDLLFELAGRVAYDAYPIDLSGDERMEVVIVGPEPAIWSPR